MYWTQTLTIIASVAGVLTGYAFLFDKRFGDLHKRIEDTNKRIDDTNKRIDDLREDLNRRMDRLEHRMDKLEDEIKEIRMLLYKVLEIPHKEEK